MAKIHSYCSVQEGRVMLNGHEEFQVPTDSGISGTLKAIYKKLNPEYSKFFKMDHLSKLGFLAAEVLMSNSGMSFEMKNETGLFLCNSTASLDTDLNHARSIADRENYVPSPSVFVYTLPNIVMGEIAIRHKIKGENTFLIFDKFEADFTQQYATLLIETYGIEHLLLGWIDVLGQEYRAFLSLISKNNGSKLEEPVFSPENLNKAYQNKLF